MQRFGVAASDIFAARHTEEFSRLIAFQAQRVQACYADALAALPPEDRRAQRPGLIMAAIYRALLEEIASDGYQVLSQRTALTPARKLWIAGKTWVTA
jgi:15-cis-phytoene synthase